MAQLGGQGAAGGGPLHVLTLGRVCGGLGGWGEGVGVQV